MRHIFLFLIQILILIFYLIALYVRIITDIDVRSRVWKRKYYHDLQHREEQLKHTRTSEQKIKENLNKNDNEKKKNITENKNSKIQDSDTGEISSSGDPGLHSGITAPEGGGFLLTLCYD
jgi:predicted Holliday junction resolvase-like endonuclease